MALINGWFVGTHHAPREVGMVNVCFWYLAVSSVVRRFRTEADTGEGRLTPERLLVFTSSRLGEDPDSQSLHFMGV